MTALKRSVLIIVGVLAIIVAVVPRRGGVSRSVTSLQGLDGLYSRMQELPSGFNKVDLIQSLLKSPLDEVRFADGQPIDGWGKPYRLMNYAEASNELRAVLPQAPVLIWSVGKNGIDEAGRGDDITVYGPFYNRWRAERISKKFNLPLQKSTNAPSPN